MAHHELEKAGPASTGRADNARKSRAAARGNVLRVHQRPAPTKCSARSISAFAAISVPSTTG